MLKSEKNKDHSNFAHNSTMIKSMKKVFVAGQERSTLAYISVGDSVSQSLIWNKHVTTL